MAENQQPECDINKTQEVLNLFQIPREKRGEEWIQRFHDAVKTASFASVTPQTTTGPDRFPYFVLNTPEPNQPFTSFCISNLTEYLIQNGLGVVINPVEGDVDWVFSYGDILNLYLRGEFLTNENKLPEYGTEKIEKDDQILVAQPSEEYLPRVTRDILKSFLIYTGVTNPKIMMFIQKRDGQSYQQLAFNVHPEDFGTNEDLNFRLQQISWFLPRHYIVSAFPKSSNLVENMVAL